MALAQLSTGQRQAVMGDAVGVFLIGVPVSSLTGSDREGLIAQKKREACSDPDRRGRPALRGKLDSRQIVPTILLLVALSIPPFISPHEPPMTPWPAKIQQVQGCCKVCRKGCACGDSCISCSKRCHKGSGCACDG